MSQATQHQYPKKLPLAVTVPLEYSLSWFYMIPSHAFSLSLSLSLKLPLSILHVTILFYIPTPH
jgi:hypothetical protein